MICLQPTLSSASISLKPTTLMSSFSTSIKLIFALSLQPQHPFIKTISVALLKMSKPSQTVTLHTSRKCLTWAVPLKQSLLIISFLVDAQNNLLLSIRQTFICLNLYLQQHEIDLWHHRLSFPHLLQQSCLSRLQTDHFILAG